MKTIKLELDYPEKEYRSLDRLSPDGQVEERGKVIPGGKKKLTMNLLYTGFNGMYKSDPQGGGGGMTREELKMWSKIQTKMEEAEDDKKKSDMELSDEQFDLVFKVIDKFKFPPAFARIYDVFSEHLEELSRTKTKVDDKPAKAGE